MNGLNQLVNQINKSVLHPEKKIKMAAADNTHTPILILQSYVDRMEQIKASLTYYETEFEDNAGDEKRQAYCRARMVELRSEFRLVSDLAKVVYHDAQIAYDPDRQQ